MESNSESIQNSIPKFVCSACGKCCSKIKGLTSEEEKQFIEEFGYGKMPLVQTISTLDMTFPLWDFEAKRFREYEKSANINANIIPSRGIFDLNTNRFILLSYQMSITDSDACPFLNENGKCLIYNTKRAFVCHLFPFNKSPFLNTGADIDNSENLFGFCPNLKQIIPKLDFKNKISKNNLINQLYDSFGDAFLASVQHDIVAEWSNKTIIEIMKKQIIRPAMNQPYKFLKKRIENAIESGKIIDFTDFLVECNIFTRDEMDSKIKRFENCDDALERLIEFKTKV